MKKIAVISIAIVVSLALSSLLSSCIVIPDQQTEPTPPPATEPEPTPEPEPAPEPEPNPDEPVETAPFEDIVWLLEAYGDRGSLKTPISDTEITAEFKSDNKTVMGTGGCNSYFVKYEIENDTITLIPPVVATEMACNPPVMNQEQEYFELLETIETYLIHNNKLIISSYGNKEMVFVEKTDEEEEQEEAEVPPIEDISWELEAYGDRGSLEEPLEDTTITVEFQSDDGRVGGSAGCNSYSADYEIDGDELTIIPPINTTMMLCFPTSVMDQEHEYLELLESSETFTIEGDKLFISCADNKKLVFIEE